MRVYRLILGQDDAAAGHAVGAQQVQQAADVVAAVGRGGLLQVGLAAMDGTQIALEDLGFGQVVSMAGYSAWTRWRKVSVVWPAPPTMT